MELTKYIETQKTQIQNLLGDNSERFMRTLLQIVSNNDKLKVCEPNSILNAAFQAATLGLEISPTIGHAYIIPYSEKDKTTNQFVDKAQFQIGYKGLIQLALRTDKVIKLSVTEIYEGQIIKHDPLQGNKYDFSVKSDKIVGYAAYIRLANGFNKSIYWSVEKVIAHAAKFSKTFKYDSSVWKKEFDAMAKKTILKALLATYAPLNADVVYILNSESETIDIESENVNEPPPLPILIDSRFPNMLNALKNGTSKWENLKEKFAYTDTQLVEIEKVLEELKNAI